MRARIKRGRETRPRAPLFPFQLAFLKVDRKAPSLSLSLEPASQPRVRNAPLSRARLFSQTLSSEYLCASHPIHVRGGVRDLVRCWVRTGPSRTMARVARGPTRDQVPRDRARTRAIHRPTLHPFCQNARWDARVGRRSRAASCAQAAGAKLSAIATARHTRMPPCCDYLRFTGQFANVRPGNSFYFPRSRVLVRSLRHNSKRSMALESSDTDRARKETADPRPPRPSVRVGSVAGIVESRRDPVRDTSL